MRRTAGGLVWVVFLAAGVLLGACASERQQQARDDLCRFGPRSAPFLIAYYSEQGVLATGDIEPEKWAAEGYSHIPSAYARPAIDVYEQKRRKDCYNETGKYWYPCTETVEVDLREHGAIIRGLSLDRAAEDAVKYCNRETIKAIPEVDRQQLTSAEYRCVVLARRECPIP